MMTSFENLLKREKFSVPERGKPKPLLSLQEKLEPGEVLLMRNSWWVCRGEPRNGMSFAKTQKEVFMRRYVEAVGREENLCMYAYTSEKLLGGKIQLQVDIDWSTGELPETASLAVKQRVIPFQEALKKELLKVFPGPFPEPLVYTCHRKTKEGAWRKFSFHLHYPGIACTSHLHGKQLIKQVKAVMNEAEEGSGDCVDEMVYRPGWMRLPGSRKHDIEKAEDERFSPPFERLLQFDTRKGIGGDLCLEAAFPDYLDEGHLVLGEKQLPLPTLKRKRVVLAASSSFKKQEDNSEMEEKIAVALRGARPAGTQMDFTVQYDKENKYYLYTNGTVPCVFNSLKPHGRNNMTVYVEEGGWLNLWCLDCKRIEKVKLY